MTASYLRNLYKTSNIVGVTPLFLKIQNTGKILHLSGPKLILAPININTINEKYK